MVGVCGCVTTTQGLLSWISPQWIGIRWGAKLSRLMNVIVLTLTVSFYFMSIRLLRNLKKQQHLISEETHKLTKMVFIYVTLLIVFYMPVIVIQLMNGQIIASLSKTTAGALSFLTYYMPSFHAIFIHGYSYLPLKLIIFIHSVNGIVLCLIISMRLCFWWKTERVDGWLWEEFCVESCYLLTQ